jgi:prepilin peptidase CpaA
MDSLIWWPTLTLVVGAAIVDLRHRRIPNWLVLPSLAAGIAIGLARRGAAGLGASLGGVALAALAMGVLCWLRAIGMGDLKLCAAVGALVGARQLGIALVIMAITGGAMAVVWAGRHGALKESFEGAGDLLVGLRRRGLRPHPSLALDNPQAHKMPYAPAIAIGTIFSFFC